jgi:hypothetical protein
MVRLVRFIQTTKFLSISFNVILFMTKDIMIAQIYITLERQM